MNNPSKHDPLTPLPLSDEEKAFLRSRGEDEVFLTRNDESADHTFDACPICGYPSHRSSTPKGMGVTWLFLGERPCTMCSQFQTDHPQFFAFVLGVVRGRSFLDKKLARAEKEAAEKASGT